MATKSKLLYLLLLALSIFHITAAEYTIGVNYGMFADNLPPPSQVAQFLQHQTVINKVKLFDANPDVIQAFANTNISLTISVANADIIQLAKLPAAQAWISNYVLPFYPHTIIKYIAVGNEVMATTDKTMKSRLLPAMKSLHNALTALNITDIKVSTPHSLGILSLSEPPSNGRFRRGYDKVVFAPILQFHRDTKTPFMINPYPYFGYSNTTLNYALFKPNSGVYDKDTGMTYTNMFDAQLDAVYSAMKRLDYDDVEIVVAETGWPSVGDPDQPDVNLENAISYNGNLIKHVNSGTGTPLMPGKVFETYIFSLFNENLKPGPTAERNFGVLMPDFSPVYSVGILLDEAEAPDAAPTPMAKPTPPASMPTPPAPTLPAPTAPAPRAPAPTESGSLWCVPKSQANEDLLQANIDYVCRLGIDCTPIQDGGPCFQPDTIRSHAAFAMNAYYQTYGQDDLNCNFAGTGIVITSDPSYATCKYVS